MNRSRPHSALALLAALSTMLAGALVPVPGALAQARTGHPTHHAACPRSPSAQLRHSRRCAPSARHSRRHTRVRRVTPLTRRSAHRSAHERRASRRNAGPPALPALPAVQASESTAQSACASGGAQLPGAEESLACSPAATPTCEDGSPEALSSDGTMFECGRWPVSANPAATCEAGSCVALGEAECEGSSADSAPACEVATDGESPS